jgi:hypothetical protein
MSWQDSDAVRKLFVGNSAAKSVLRCLADFRNEKTGLCNPSTDTIAKETELNRKTVYKAITYLEEKGFIRRERVVLNSSNNYVLNLSASTDSPKNGSTKNGSTKCGTSPKNGLPVVPNMGRVVVPNMGHEPVNEQVNETITLSKEREEQNFSLTPTEKKVSKKQTAAKKEKKGPYPYSENDPIPDEFLKIAQANNIQNPQELFKKMVLWCQANGRPYKNWKAGFTTWCLREVGYQKEKEQKAKQAASKQNQFSYEPPGGFTDDYYRDQCEFDEHGNLKL